MQKQEPVVTTSDYTDDELCEWMCQEVNAVQGLRWANEAKIKQAENLSALEQDIIKLEKSSGIKHRQNGHVPTLIVNQRG